MSEHKTFVFVVLLTGSCQLFLQDDPNLFPYLLPLSLLKAEGKEE